MPKSYKIWGIFISYIEVLDAKGVCECYSQLPWLRISVILLIFEVTFYTVPACTALIENGFDYFFPSVVLYHECLFGPAMAT